MAKIAEMQEVRLDMLKPYEKNAKVHGEKQIEQLMNSIKEFGFISPCLVERDTNNLIAGHGRIEAAKRLGMETVPCVFVEDLTEEQRRAYILADNRLTELGGWDHEVVDAELRDLYAAGFDISLTGFELDLDKVEVDTGGGEKVDPTVVLPESRIFVVAISAFGVKAETFIEAKLTQEEADHLLSRFDQLSASDVVAKLRGVISGL